MINIEILNAVKQILIKEYGYDFKSEFWYDSNIVLMQEIIEATIKAIENNQ